MPYTGFSVPNASAAAFAAQAELFSQDLQILSDADHGNGVLTGCAVTQRGAGANMSVDVAAGNILRETASVAVAGGNAVISAAHATLPRLDLVSANNVGALVVTTGTAAAVPEPPTIPQVSNVNNIVLAFVYVPAADTAINTNQITDKRVVVAAPGGGSGTVTHTVGALTADRLVMGNGGADIEVLGAGTTVTVLHGNAAGAPTFAAVSLTADVSGDLPYANLVPATAATKLLGRGSAGGAGDWQEITPGSGLTMSGTTLTASGSGSGPVSVLALASDATANTTITGVAITGLTKTATGTGTFVFEYWVRYDTAATGTGIRFGINHTGTVTRVIAQTRMVGAAGAADQLVGNPPVSLSGSATRSLSTTAPDLISAGVDTASADMLMVIEGLISVTADGNLELWSASEIAASAVQVLADSSLILTKTL